MNDDIIEKITWGIMSLVNFIGGFISANFFWYILMLYFYYPPFGKWVFGVIDGLFTIIILGSGFWFIMFLTEYIGDNLSYRIFYDYSTIAIFVIMGYGLFILYVTILNFFIPTDWSIFIDNILPFS